MVPLQTAGRNLGTDRRETSAESKVHLMTLGNETIWGKDRQELSGSLGFEIRERTILFLLRYLAGQRVVFNTKISCFDNLG